METAKALRGDYEAKLKDLQDRCKHTKSKWMDYYWAPAHWGGKHRICLRCEKTLERAKIDDFSSVTTTSDDAEYTVINV